MKCCIGVRQASSLGHAQQLLQQFQPQLVIFDLLASLSANQQSAPLPPKLLADITDMAQRLTGPFLLLVPALPAPTRLQLVQCGVSQLLDRTSPAPQLMSEALRTMRATTTPAKILIVDDDPQILQLLQVSLAPWNFDITTLTDGNNLWAAMEENKPDALVLDVSMPAMNGFEICQLLRADPRWRTLPILFLTMHQEDVIRGRAFHFGANDFINKSVAASELAVRILNQIRHRE
ncbi:MAG: response regulator [Cyanobacteria bacterium P01_D01_bin.2]